METLTRNDVPDHRPPGGALLAIGLWLRGAFAGTAVAAAGVASLFDATHPLPTLTAITWIAAGGTFAWLSWQRAQTRLDRLDADESAARGAEHAQRPPRLARAGAAS